MVWYIDGTERTIKRKPLMQDKLLRKHTCQAKRLRDYHGSEQRGVLRGEINGLARDLLEMTDSCNQELERNGDASTSDDDSLSLLCDLNACQSRGAAEDMEISDLDSQVGNKEQEKEMEKEINRLKPPESGISSCSQSAAGSANSASQLAANVLQCVKIPNKKQLHKRDGKGETLLHKACHRGDLARVKVLIQAGISVNMQDHAGWTALHEASAAGDEAIVEELLKAGADVNARSFNSVTPLHDAVISGNYQVVNRLLQHGASSSDRHGGGLSALDMAKEENIKELLLTFQASSFEASAKYRKAGDTSSEAHCHMQLSCQSSFSPSHNDTANVQSRESGDRDGAREPGDIQLRKKDATSFNPSCSEAVTASLEEVEKKHKEISTWPLASPEDAGRYQAALTHIQNVLIEVQTQQQLEKDNLVIKYRSVCDCLRQRVLKSQLVSLASRQRTLVEILQKQKHLEEVFVTMKAQLSSQPPIHPSSTVLRWQPDHLSIPASTPASSKDSEAHSCEQDSQRNASQRPVTWASLLRSALPNNGKDLTMPRPPAPLISQRKKNSTHTDVLNKKANSCQSCSQQPENTLQRINFQMKGNNALIQTRAEDNSRHISKLIQWGVLSSGSTLQLLWKGHRHLAHVLGDSSIKDSKGKLHLAPERWLESILGNNIPVSSAYAWDKVTFRDKPLSYYVLNMEAEGNAPQTCPEDNVQHDKAGSSQEALPTGAGAAGLNGLMKIKIIHLVDDEELLPNAMLDYYWEKLLKKESED